MWMPGYACLFFVDVQQIHGLFLPHWPGSRWGRSRKAVTAGPTGGQWLSGCFMFNVVIWLNTPVIPMSQILPTLGSFQKPRGLLLIHRWYSFQKCNMISRAAIISSVDNIKSQLFIFASCDLTVRKVGNKRTGRGRYRMEKADGGLIFNCLCIFRVWTSLEPI